MTDERLRDADPFDPSIVVRLDGAEQTLLEEIMSTDRVIHPWRRRLVTAVAAAAVLIAVLAVSVIVRLRAPEDHAATPATPAISTGRWSPVALKAAERNPRLLIDEPGWVAKTVYGFAEKNGTIGFVKGERNLEMNWYPADAYEDYRLDRKEVSKPEPGQIPGWSGDVYTYNASDFALQLKPRDGVFVELRTGGKWNRAEFDRVLTHVVQVDVETWLEALPPEIVTPGRADEAAAKVLTGVPIPPKFDRSKIEALGANDPYQFGAQVMALVGCGWIAEFERARRAGDTEAVNRAKAALSSSRKWKVLNDMNAEGDYPEVFWEYADRATSGRDPGGYQQALGC
ncbi:hypothetical protein ACQPZX_17415 [Actinoplanes sp. CA-142083]|uniref:hypothetical protein n=1 Tax=Actinoplanes sp. CA-142083 TaxID=3239903 RepID=UPI003D8DA699